MDKKKLKSEKFANAKRLTEIEKDLRTCIVFCVGKTHWTKKAKRKRLIAEKMQLQERTNCIRKALT
tara:strand:+ start:265 stop:462 length:198 start_codon:yes stop_codon:yes gene_type:complete